MGPKSVGPTCSAQWRRRFARPRRLVPRQQREMPAQMLVLSDPERATREQPVLVQWFWFFFLGRWQSEAHTMVPPTAYEAQPKKALTGAACSPQSGCDGLYCRSDAIEGWWWSSSCTINAGTAINVRFFWFLLQQPKRLQALPGGQQGPIAGVSTINARPHGVLADKLNAACHFNLRFLRGFPRPRWRTNRRLGVGWRAGLEGWRVWGPWQGSGPPGIRPPGMLQGTGVAYTSIELHQL